MPTILDRKVPLPELAKSWGWSEDKLRRLVAMDAIPYLRIRGRIYFETAALERWMAAMRRTERRAQPPEESEPLRRRSATEERQALGLEKHHVFS